MMPPHVGVICDENTMIVRRVIVQGDHEDGTRLFDGTHKPLAGEVMAVIPKSMVAGLSLHDMATAAVLRQFGRTPPVE
jgi:hypothetical protein